MKTKQERTKKGIVVSDKMDKGIVVRIDYRKLDKKFKKTIKQSIKVMAHDEKNEAKQGDVVKIKETRPLSKRKRYVLLEVMQRPEVVA
ncbi:MAG: 30S ribosomal protein S17 [Spirochaetia bacterium]|nr:30S ribosomal protein S17 [Spirochaetia bacterium]